MNPIQFLKNKTQSLREAVASAPSNLVRTDKFQKGRDFLLDFARVAEPEKRFVQAMTGGLNEGITELPDKYIGPIKGAFNQKVNQKELFEKARKEFSANPGKYDRKFITWKGEEVSQPGHLRDVLAGKDFYGSPQAVPTGVFKQPEEGGGVSFYGAPRDLHLSLGHANVTRDDQGNVRLTDTWDVDHDPVRHTSKWVEGGGENVWHEGMQASGGYEYQPSPERHESQKDYSDLQEGGRFASTIYNIARNLNTYEPLQYNVSIPADKWESTKAVTPLSVQQKDMDLTPGWVKSVNKLINSRSRFKGYN